MDETVDELKAQNDLIDDVIKFILDKLDIFNYENIINYLILRKSINSDKIKKILDDMEKKSI